MAVELEKGDLPMSRARWMLGAHLLTAGEHGGAAEQFAAAERAAAAVGAAPEIGLARSFRELAGVAGGEATATSRLAGELAAMRSTARRVLGC